MTPDDKYLLEAVKRGHKEAFNRLFDRYASQLYHVTLKYVGRPEDAEEIVQEVFVKIWIYRSGLQPHLPFVPYLIKISKNLVINKSKKRLYEEAYIKHKTLSGMNYNHVTDNQVVLKELQDLLEIKISQLPEKRKQIYKLSREQGLSNREIAEKLVVSESTVENHINKALKDLKSYLKEYKYLSLIPHLTLLSLTFIY